MKKSLLLSSALTIVVAICVGTDHTTQPAYSDSSYGMDDMEPVSRQHQRTTYS